MPESEESDYHHIWILEFDSKNKKKPVEKCDGYVGGEDDGIGREKAEEEQKPAEGETPGVGGE